MDKVGTGTKYNVQLSSSKGTVTLRIVAASLLEALNEAAKTATPVLGSDFTEMSTYAKNDYDDSW